MSNPQRVCPDCASETSLPRVRVLERSPVDDGLSRRDFLRTAGVAVAVGSLPALGHAAETAPAKAVAAKAAAKSPESVVKLFYDSLKESQKKAVCFDWDHTEKGDKGRGLLRTHVSNNWKITEHDINGDFYTKDQRAMVRDIFEGIINPDWHKRIYKQLEDDAGGFGEQQSLAIFGQPGDGKFEFVMTGRHMTLRCDGNSGEHVAFGGPIFYGHAASGFNEKEGHPGNVFWEQALAANDVFKMLDGKQQATALIDKAPQESKVAFRGKAKDIAGIPVAELSKDQKELVQKVLKKLLEPYRQLDRDEVAACLKTQGGLDECRLAFYKEGDLGSDKVWDIWRLEGPAFVWHFRGTPHVHVWVNVADDPAVKLNARG